MGTLLCDSNSHPSMEVYTEEPGSLSNAVVVKIYNSFVASFESSFNVTQNGTLRCTKKERRAVESFFEKYRLLIAVVTGVDIPDVSFLDPTQGDIGASNENKKNMLNLYGIAFAAYLKYCQTLKRNIHSSYVIPENMRIAEDESE